MECSSSQLSCLSRRVYLDGSVVASDLYDSGLSIGGSHSIHGLTKLHLACGRGQLELVKNILSLQPGNSSVNAATDDGKHTALFFAAIHDHVDVVRALVEAGANVNVKSLLHDTPLATACRRGHAQVAEELVNLGADLSVVTRNNDTVLHAAASGGHSRLVSALVRHGLDVNARNRHDQTPLHMAASGGHVAAAKVLVRHGAKLDHTFVSLGTGAEDEASYKGVTALHLAAHCGSPLMTEMLLEAGANQRTKDCAGFAPIHVAALCGHVNVVRTYMQLAGHKDDWVECGTADDETPLHLAVQYDRHSVIRALLNVVSSESVNRKTKAEGYSALHVAAEYGSNTAVAALVAAGANINARTTDSGRLTPLHLSVLRRHHRLAEELIARGADVNMVDSDYSTPLHGAAATGCPFSLIKALLNAGADVDSRNNEMCTPFLLAVMNGHLGLVKLLLKFGAEYRAVNRWDWTSLHLAAVKGHVEVASHLLNYRNQLTFWAHCKSRAQFCERKAPPTPLKLAARHNHADMVRFLVANGADINDCDRHGRSLLHDACIGRNLSMARLLLDLGIDINLRTYREGRTALHAAVRCSDGAAAMTALLMRYGADANVTDRRDYTALEMAVERCETNGNYNKFRRYSE